MGESGIGPIVWVRRRNGSWWPGKIMEPQQIPNSNLSSPRTGTPVKLLGRQDASVDWYNLEKSKRVKAFRCGEFDDCIEKAESAQGMPIKKREKYARREDAILHALELEKELLRTQGKSGLSSDQLGSETSSEKKLGVTSGGLENDVAHGNEKYNNNISEREDVHIDMVAGNHKHMLEAKDGDHSLLEDNHCVETPRTRGLRDFGLRTAPLKRKRSSSVDSDDSAKLMEDKRSQGPICVPSIERTNLANVFPFSEEDKEFSICRAKRSRSVYLSTESSASRDGKGYLLNQDKMPQFEDNDCHNLRECLNQENYTSEFTGDVASDCSESESDCSESESDSSETEPDFEDEMAAFPEQGALRRKRREELESCSSEDLDDPYFVNEAVSNWLLKRRRNNRFLTNNLADRVNDRNFGEHLHGNFYRTRASSLGQRAYGFDDDDGDDDEDESFERKYIGTQMLGLNNRSYASRFASRNLNNYSRGMIDWDSRNFEGQHFFKGHWDDRREFFNPRLGGRHYFGGSPRSTLIDVDLKVQGSYPKQRVPIVSLTSKLDGKAIIGHPIQIEVLEDGSTETLVSTSYDYQDEVIGHDRNMAIAPAWRTARRTSFRVPRPNLPSVLGDDDGDKDFSVIELERLPFKQINAGSFSPKGDLIRMGLPHISRNLPDKTPPGSLLKKVYSSPNQKTRTLSSIGVQQSFGNKPGLGNINNQWEGLRKPETSSLTTVACIPVKLVFSRLLEKINRPPSKAASKTVVSRKDGEEQPS